MAGDSAGGTLAAVAAVLAAEQGGPVIEYQVLLYPGVGVEPGQESLEEHAGIVLSAADLEWFRDCYFGSEVHLRNRMRIRRRLQMCRECRRRRW